MRIGIKWGEDNLEKNGWDGNKSIDDGMENNRIMVRKG